MDDGTHTMVYCIWNKKKKQYLKNNFKSHDKDESCLNFVKLLIHIMWMDDKRVDGTENQYTLFSMSNYSHKNDKFGDTLLSLATFDPIGPIYKAIRDGYDFPFNQEFILPIFIHFFK